MKTDLNAVISSLSAELPEADGAKVPEKDNCDPLYDRTLRPKERVAGHIREGLGRILKMRDEARALAEISGKQEEATAILNRAAAAAQRLIELKKLPVGYCREVDLFEDLMTAKYGVTLAWAARSLQGVRTPAVVEWLMRGIEEAPRSETATACLTALKHTQDERAIKLACRLLDKVCLDATMDSVWLKAAVEGISEAEDVSVRRVLYHGLEEALNESFATIYIHALQKRGSPGEILRIADYNLHHCSLYWCISAIRSLHGSTHPGVAQWLASAGIQDEHEEIREASFEALYVCAMHSAGGIQNSDLTARLKAMLATAEKPQEKLACIRALTGTRDPEAVKMLLNKGLFSRDDWKLSHAAARALRGTTDPGVLHSLEVQFIIAIAPVAEEAAFSLQGTTNRETLDRLIWNIDWSLQDFHREYSTLALRGTADVWAANALFRALWNKNHAIRMAAADSLQKCSQPEVGGELIKLCRTASEENVRAAVARILWDRGEAEAREAVLDALRHDPHRQVREAAAQGLGRVGDPETQMRLCEIALIEEDSGVLKAIASALNGVSAEPVIDWLVETGLKHETPRMRSFAAQALRGCADGKALSFLYEMLLTETDDEIARSCIYSLKEIPSVEIIDKFFSIARGSLSRQKRALAVDALKSFEDSEISLEIETDHTLVNLIPEGPLKSYLERECAAARSIDHLPTRNSRFQMLEHLKKLGEIHFVISAKIKDLQEQPSILERLSVARELRYEKSPQVLRAKLESLRKEVSPRVREELAAGLALLDDDEVRYTLKEAGF